ncbi:MAG: ABC transporter ATP-binding protein/permease, partial [Ureaplasma sp.]|nr:ABC transporter ATP-binding protein/permease [Ureaplasma sp.]
DVYKIKVYYISGWFAHFILYFLNAKISQKAVYRIRNDLFKKINELPMNYFDKNTPGDIMSNFTNDVNNISVFLSDSLADFFGFLIWSIGIGIALLVLSWSLGLIVMGLLLISLFVIINKVRKSLPYYTTLQKELANFTSIIEENVAGQGIVDLFQQQEQFKERFEKVQKHLIDQWEKATFFSLQSYPYVDLFSNSIIVIITAIGILFINFDINFVNIPILIGDSSTLAVIGFMSIYILLVRNFLSALNQLPMVFNIGLSMKVGVSRLMDIFDKKSEFNTFEKIIIVLANEISKKQDNSKNMKTLLPEVKFDKVYFEYEKNVPILKNVSFEIKKQQFVGIVGPTGSGKTTLINLLTKLYEINKGTISIGGISIKEINRDSLRNNITLVLQDTFLFNRSIRENLKLGNPSASEEWIIEACKKAHCHNLIMELENGYDTILSNDSNTLSKGQKQLISIARAIITDSKLIVFDEATSSVDIQTEKLIHLAMKNLFKERTVVMIAHNLSTIRNADNILVIKSGELIESGNHNQLLKLDGFYAQLHKSQINELD